MPTYLPIEVTPIIRASHSNLLQLRWAKQGVVADFIIPENNQDALRVQFLRTEMIRIIEEMPISTESEETPNDGLIAEHFAYEVQGASFWNQQSEAFKVVYQKAKHYRFITGFYCLDVIASNEPIFTVVPTSAFPS
ncbi:MAG: hypothetical protein JO025_03400 [Verrucomicrobia bacterium]|nr:hypothetical protein [Verrucomicrobiota bacterium]